MKRTIIKAFIFTVGLYILTFIIQILITSFVKLINVGDYGVLNRINTGQINSQILISGSSRAYVHFDPSIIQTNTGKSCYNIAANGSGLEHQVPILKYYLSNNKKPDILVQEISINTLNNFAKKIYSPHKYIPYINNDSLYNGLLSIDKTFWIHKYFPISNIVYFNVDFQRQVIRDSVLSIKGSEDVLMNGYSPQHLTWMKYADKYIEDHKSGLRYKIERSMVELLLAEADICNRNDIKLIYVMPPQYYGVVELQRNRDEIISFYKKISRENNIIFLDYTNMSIGKDKKYFYNNQHLNFKGASIFSDKFSNDLKQLIKQ